MQAIADESQISKSLLFYYFKNKRTLYEDLFKLALSQLNQQRLPAEQTTDFFWMLEAEIKERLRLMQEYPLIFRFIMKVYQDQQDPQLDQTRLFITQLEQQKKKQVLSQIDLLKFTDPEAVSLLYDLIFDLADGYYQRISDQLWKQPEAVIAVFRSYLDSLREHYYRKD
ncbi:hypothetical protein SDC9_138975 [bioreactor metagenome]|uniref:HTH tetR-type domain-containing protein n=1 Tax=bioreactor metagenome TaxID=1076179 RepID=A0A645DRB4_9ZZZZ